MLIDTLESTHVDVFLHGRSHAVDPAEVCALGHTQVGLDEEAVVAQGGKDVAEAVAEVGALRIARLGASRPALVAWYRLRSRRRLQLDHQDQHDTHGNSHLERRHLLGWIWI